MIAVVLVYLFFRAPSEKCATQTPTNSCENAFPESEDATIKEDINPLPTISAIFEETALSAQQRGFKKTTSIGHRRYFFPNQDIESNYAFVVATEQIINEVKNIFPSTTELREINRIYLASNRDEYRFELRPILLYLSIRHDCLDNIGWLTHAKSEQRLPMWLSVGIEAVARSRIGLYSQSQINAFSENFGDLLFTPINWGATEHVNAVASSYSFVKFLDAYGYLPKIINYYMAHNQQSARALSSSAFYRFVGKYGPTTHYLHFDAEGGYAFNTGTDMAFYSFVFDSIYEYIEFERIMNYVNFMDDGIRVAVGWYKEFYDFYFTPIEVNIFYNPGRGLGFAYYPWRIHLYNLRRFPPHSISHEASHLLTTLISNDYDKIFTPFDEGLAFYLMAKHGIYDRFNHGFQLQYRYYATMHHIDSMSGGFYGVEAIVRELLSNSDFIGLDHFFAYLVLGQYIEGLCLVPWFWTRASRVMYGQYESIGDISTFQTAASFVAYLIEEYGAKAYMQVHFDVSSFEYVYGVSICEMIDSWKLFLSNFTDYVAGR